MRYNPSNLRRKLDERGILKVSVNTITGNPHTDPELFRRMLLAGTLDIRRNDDVTLGWEIVVESLDGRKVSQRIEGEGAKLEIGESEEEILDYFADMLK